MLEGVVDGVAPHETTCLATLHRIQQYARDVPTVYLPSHDPDAVARLAARQTVPAESADDSPSSILVPHQSTLSPV